MDRGRGQGWGPSEGTSEMGSCRVPEIQEGRTGVATWGAGVVRSSLGGPPPVAPRNPCRPNQSLSQSIDQSTNKQSIKQSINQSIDQSNDRLIAAQSIALCLGLHQVTAQLCT